MKTDLFEEIEFSLPIKIDSDCEYKVEEGAEIDKGDVLVSTKNNLKEVLNYRQKLKLKVEDKKGLFVRVAVGDRCRKGSVLVEKISYFSRTKVLCPFDAIIVSVSDSEIKLEQYRTVEILSPFKGKVSRIDGGQIIISTVGRQHQFGYGGGKSVWGDLIVYADQEDLDSDWLSVDYKNKVIVINNLTQVLWQKANALGVKGLIAKKASTVFEQWIDPRRDSCGVLVYEENEHEWDKVVDYLFGLKNPTGFILAEQKLLVVT